MKRGQEKRRMKKFKSELRRRGVTLENYFVLLRRVNRLADRLLGGKINGPA